jgi:hypothetical protein
MTEGGRRDTNYQYVASDLGQSPVPSKAHITIQKVFYVR